jgi:hypothetical protein
MRRRRFSPCAVLAMRQAISYSYSQHTEGSDMGQSGIRRTAFALLAVLMIYAALTGMGA